MANVLVMSQREREQAAVVKEVVKGRYSAREAAELLKLTRRHVFRLLARYRAEGDAGLVHGLRGRASNRGYPKKLKARVLALYWRPEYRDYGPTYFAETLAKEHKIWVHRETMRRWLNANGGSNAQRRKRPHRKKRLRRAAVGELVQFDGSTHDWFEGRGPECTLLHMVDDATSRAFMRFAPSENTADCMRTFWAYAERYGLPRCLYVDQDGVYCPEKEGTLTEFGRAMVELGVQIIYANSPEAKGRVERGNRTHQDRLVKAMRRKGIASIGAANRFLEAGGYLAEHNAKFSLPTKDLPDVHQPLPAGLHLERVLCFQTTRYLRRDYTISLDAQYVQIERGPYALPRVTDHVIVRRYLDGSLHIFSRQEEELRFTVLSGKPAPRKPPVIMPAESHPWRLKFAGSKRKIWRRRRSWQSQSK